MEACQGFKCVLLLCVEYDSSLCMQLLIRFSCKCDWVSCLIGMLDVNVCIFFFLYWSKKKRIPAYLNNLSFLSVLMN